MPNGWLLGLGTLYSIKAHDPAWSSSIGFFNCLIPYCHSSLISLQLSSDLFFVFKDLPLFCVCVLCLHDLPLFPMISKKGESSTSMCWLLSWTWERHSEVHRTASHRAWSIVYKFNFVLGAIFPKLIIAVFSLTCVCDSRLDVSKQIRFGRLV